MKKFFLIIVFILTSCSPQLIKKDIDFSNDMDLNEFKIKLKVYAENKPYPNIDK